jgi:recombinational DNA repair protein RecT
MPGELEQYRRAEVAMRKMLAPYEQALGELIPRTGVTASAFMVSLRTAVTRDEYTFNVAQQNPESVLTAGMKCAIWGHQPGTKFAALVAFGGKAPKIEAIEQYHGIVNRAQRAAPGLVLAADVVRENDRFVPPATLGEPLVHEIVGGPFATRAERGKVIGTYAQARLPQGMFTQAVMIPEEEMAEIRKLSRTDQFWIKHPLPMRMKAAIKRIRGLPESSEWRQETDKLLVASDRIASQFNAAVPALDDDSVEYVDVDPSDIVNP